MDVGHARHLLQLTLDSPVLDRAQIHRTQVVATQTVAINLTDCRRQRGKLRRDAIRQIGIAQPLSHLLACEIGGRLVVERENEERQAKLRVREHAHRAGQPREGHFEWNRDLLFDFLGCASREQCDDGDLRIGYVGKGLDGQLQKSRDAAGDEQNRAEQHEHRLTQTEPDEIVDHAGRVNCRFRCRASVAAAASRQ